MTGLKRGIVLFWCAVSLAAHAQTDAIGKVVVARPDVEVRRDDQRLELSRGDALYVGDHVVTDESGRFSARLKDGTVVRLGAESDMVFEEYTYEPERQQGNAVFRATEGAFRVITGKIQSLSDRGFSVDTPVASIGIRGTDFWGGFIFGEQLDVTVLSGKGVYVDTPSGRVLLDEGQGTTVKLGNPVPSKPKSWPREKVDKALASVGLD